MIVNMYRKYIFSEMNANRRKRHTSHFTTQTLHLTFTLILHISQCLLYIDSVKSKDQTGKDVMLLFPELNNNVRIDQTGKDVMLLFPSNKVGDFRHK